MPSVRFPPVADVEHASHKEDVNSSVRLGGATLSSVVTSALATYVIIFASHLWSEWNWVWLLGFPLLYTFVFFRRTSPWVWPLALVWLAICSFFTMMITAQMLGLGE